MIDLQTALRSTIDAMIPVNLGAEERHSLAVSGPCYSGHSTASAR